MKYVSFMAYEPLTAPFHRLYTMFVSNAQISSVVYWGSDDSLVVLQMN